MGFYPFFPFGTPPQTVLHPSGDLTGVTDTATLTGAIAAASAAATPSNVPTIQLAAGTWNLGTGQVPIVGPVKLAGTGEALVIGGSLVPGTVINCSNPTSVFTFPFQGYLWSGLEVMDIAFSYSGAGNLFHNMNLADSKFTNLQVVLSNAAGRAFFTTGNVSVLNCTWDRCYISTTTATRSAEMVHLSSSASGSVSNNTFWRCKFNNAGLDNTQYMCYIDCTGGSGAYHYIETFRDCWFEHPFGGAVKSLSGLGLVIDGSMIWDIFSGQGQTVGNSIFYVGAFAGGQGSQQTRIAGCGRNRNGPNGTTTWDMFFEATTSGTLIESFTVKPDSASTLTNAFINLNAHPDVQLIGNMSPQGALVNGNSTTVISNPSPSQTVISQGTLTWAGHLVSADTGVPAPSNLGANVTSVTPSGNDTRGALTIVMAGALAANTRVATITYAAAYGTTPKVTLVNQTSGVGIAVVNFYVLAQAAGTSYDIASDQALAAGTYVADYIVIG